MESLPDRELTLNDVLAMLRRRRRVVLGATAALVLLVAIYCVVCTPLYQSAGMVEIQKDSSDVMGLSDLMSNMSSSTSELGSNLDIQTQADVLQSETLALRTVEALHLENTKDFQSNTAEEWFKDRLMPSFADDAPGVPLEAAPKRRQRILKRFADRLTVRPNPGTRLIEVDYLNPDPQVSSAVVNTLMKSLMDFNFQTRYDATNQASAWLNNQLGDLRKQTESLQARLAELQKQSGVYSFGITDAQGKVSGYSAILDALQQSSQALNAAMQNRILKGAIEKAAEQGDAEMLSGLAGNIAGNGAATNNSLAVIQALRQQQAAQQSSLQQALTKYGAENPKVAELRGAMAGTEHAIREEVKRIQARAKSDFEIAARLEEQTRRKYEEQKREADALNKKAVEYTVVLQEAEGSRLLYEDLCKRLKEAGVLAGLRSSNITIVDPGRANARAKRPNIPLYLAMSLFGGLLLGFGSAYVAESLDNKIHTVADLEQVLGHNVLGVTPDYSCKRLRRGSAQEKGRSSAVALVEPQSSYTEALRAVRTSVLLARSENAPRLILVTSSVQGEGKTTFTANFAAVLALHDKRVLIVDADLRRSSLARCFRLDPQGGLSALLAGQASEPNIQPVERIANLYALPAGAVPPNPSELLASHAMRRWLQLWREQYDFVLLDGTPVLPVSDSVILDGLCEMTILLARSKCTERQQLRQAYKTLSQNQHRYIGPVLNGMSPHDQSYYGYYGYYGYRKAAYASEQTSA